MLIVGMLAETVLPIKVRPGSIFPFRTWPGCGRSQRLYGSGDGHRAAGCLSVRHRRLRHRNAGNCQPRERVIASPGRRGTAMLTHAPTRVVRDYNSDSRYWEQYKPRPGDMHPARHRRQGRHHLDAADRQPAGLPSPRRPRHLGKVEPLAGAHASSRRWRRVLPGLEAQEHRRFIQTHLLPMDAFPATRRGPPTLPHGA